MRYRIGTLVLVVCVGIFAATTHAQGTPKTDKEAKKARSETQTLAQLRAKLKRLQALVKQRRARWRRAQAKLILLNAANTRSVAALCEESSHPNNAPINIRTTQKKIMDRLTRRGLMGLLGTKESRGGIITAKGFGGDDADALGGWYKTGKGLGGGGLGPSGKRRGGLGLSGKPNVIPRPRRSHKRRARPKVRFGKPTIFGGLDAMIIKRIVRRHRNRFLYCYERELIRNKSIIGMVSVFFQIEANGRIKRAALKKSKMKNKRVEKCLVRRFKLMRFPAPVGGSIVHVVYPLHFRPK